MKRILQHFRYSQQKTQNLILVDFNDKLIQSIDKWEAHSTKYIFNEKSFPHRAFSLFLFDKNYRLLLQQRSNAKKTFPLLWANTCCSHQLYHENEDDQVMKYSRSEYYVKKRTLEELNFDIKDTQIELVQKIIYSAKDNDQYGEYELDYIYFAKLQQDQPKINGNPEEVNDCKWLSLNEFLQFKQLNKNSFTPWFNLINDSYLLNWWSKYQENNKSFFSKETIVKLN
ncbi:unnamed protein product [Paramecium pentaurelia]|uniref:Nudix hydrolase domain-containing protein n=1 Tax=Paramecium pentaurelia TaxID=43138 RepID=A0A8S1T859_9CILI|nr:unnamed protein product [Paramecium pentaurelia]